MTKPDSKKPNAFELFGEILYRWWDLGLLTPMFFAVVAIFLAIGFSYGWALIVAVILFFFYIFMAAREEREIRRNRDHNRAA